MGLKVVGGIILRARLPVIILLFILPFVSSVAAEQSLQEDLVFMLEHSEPSMRMEAITNLIELDLIDDQVLTIFVDMLEDPDYGVTQAANKALVAGGERAIPKLGQGLAKFNSPMQITIRQNLARILAQIGGEQSVSILIDTLMDPSPQVRRAAALGLEQIGAEGIAASVPLANILLDRDEDVQVRAAAAQALGNIGYTDDIVVFALLMARVETAFQVVWAAQGSLNNLNIHTKEFIIALLNQIDNPDYTRLAHDALVHVINTADDAIDIIEELYNSDSNKRATIGGQLASAYNAIAADKHERIVRILQGALLGENQDIQLTIANSLIGKASNAVELQGPLMALIIDQGNDIQLRQAAMRAVEWVAIPDSILFDQLISVAFSHDEDQIIRDTAIRTLALSTSHRPDDVLPLLANIGSLDNQQRWLVAPLLVEAGKHLDDIIRVLSNIVIDGHGEARLYGIRILSAIGPKAELALPVLLDIILSSDDEPLRTAALRGIVQIGQDNSAIDIFLRNFARDANPDIQRIALQGLGEWEPTSPESVLAFPTAEGFGAWTPGGRGGKVYRVTNLNNRGPGSLREAVEASGPRIVIFDVAGTIFLQSDLKIQNPYITIAGQTAPGEGITIANFETSVETHDVIIRHLRFRMGDLYRREADALGVNGGNNVIIDHVSASWGMDETLSVSQSDNVTVQWSFITESMRNSYHSKGAHGYGSLVRGGYGGKYSFINNLWAHHMGRMPRPGNYNSFYMDPEGLFVDFRNNVFYNWGGNTSGANNDSDSVTKYNFINNYYIRGLNSSGSQAFREYSVKAQAYFAGNYMNGMEPVDPWALVDVRISPDIFEQEYKQEQPFESGLVTTVPAPDAYKRVLESSGALPRDAIDRRVQQSVVERTGRHIDSQIDVGGWVSVDLYPVARDSNNDGIPDWWYVKHGFDPSIGLPSDGDLNGNGFTNIEEYLNGTDPDVTW